MKPPAIRLPRAVPVPRARPAQERIPAARIERERIRALARAFVAEKRPVPPLSLAELRSLTGEFAARLNLSAPHLDWAGVIINGEMWRDQLASVPYERRLLLLPKCLRVEDRCPAKFDEFGLLCRQCGLCAIQELQDEAERLGYAVLVAEGSALVMSLLQTGKIDAVVGVSCLNVLEKAFPYVEAAAVPGMAIPLLQDDCRDVTVDLDWVWEVIRLTSADRTYRLNLDGLRDEVAGWFEEESLDALMGPADGETEAAARRWLAKQGKRWRPFLSACVWSALQEDAHAPLPRDLRRLAIAVECFHKASLVHDDIEDGDELRYGEAALHAEYGIPFALNVGDFLLGEGYQLIGRCEVPAEARVAMLEAAADGHRVLCLGQGAELAWARHPRPLSTVEVLDIFRRKTAPAFEVALRLGAACAGAHAATAGVFARYSEALGIAYQIRDDLEDAAGQTDDFSAMRPSLLAALLYERVKAKPAGQTLVEKVWRREATADERRQVAALLTDYGVIERARVLLESYKEEAVRALALLESASLKGLLRRVIGKIFTPELEGWCSEFAARNAASGSAGAARAG